MPDPVSPADQRERPEPLFERLIDWRRGLLAHFEQLALIYPTDTEFIAEAAPEMVEALHNIVDNHQPLRGDWRNGYRIVCSECSVQRSEPYYNECRSWREAADYPCGTVRQIALSIKHREGVPDV